MTLLVWKIRLMGTSQPLSELFFSPLTVQEWALGEVCWSVISNCHPYDGDYNTPGATLNDPNSHCALKNSCWPSPHKVLSCTEGGLLWRCFKLLHNRVRRMAAGVVSWFCKLFEAMRHFRPPKNISVLQDTGSDMRLKPRLTHSLPQRRSVCRLCGAS